jgi:pectate lyase
MKRLINVALLGLLLLSSVFVTAQTEPYEDLLEHRSGFAESVSGGKGGTVITITAVGDAGFIQLRNAVYEKDNPKWIRFTPGLSGEILIDQWLTIGSNTTIDGRGANITFRGKNTNDELFVWGDTNIIVHNIRFYKMGIIYDEGTAFGMSRGADLVWLDHCTFEDNSDESVTIGNEGGDPFKSRLTLSYCRWQNTIRAILLGHDEHGGRITR